MAHTKLLVGGLSYSTTDQSLTDAFSSFGNLVRAQVVIERGTGKSRGFGYVVYDNADSAAAALSAMDGKDLDGRRIHVSYPAEKAAGGDKGGAASDQGGAAGGYDGGPYSGYGGDVVTGNYANGVGGGY